LELGLTPVAPVAAVGAGLEPLHFEESLGDPPMLLGFGARRAV